MFNRRAEWSTGFGKPRFYLDYISGQWEARYTDSDGVTSRQTDYSEDLAVEKLCHYTGYKLREVFVVVVAD
jgi:hypothetical protein